MQVTFTMLQRLQLMPMLREVKGRRTDDSRKLARRILGKIKVLPPQLKKLQQTLPDGRVVADAEMLEDKQACPDLTVEITEDQADKIISLIDGFAQWGPDDDDWIDPLLTQLQEVKNQPQGG